MFFKSPFFRRYTLHGRCFIFCASTFFGSIWVSGKMPTFPSPKPSFCYKWEVSVNDSSSRWAVFEKPKLIPVFINIQTNKIPLHYYTTLLPVNAAVNNSYSKQLAAAPQIPLCFCCWLFPFQRLFLFSHYFIWWVVFAAEGEASRVGSSHIMDIKEDPKKGSVCSRYVLLTQLFWLSEQTTGSRRKTEYLIQSWAFTLCMNLYFSFVVALKKFPTFALPKMHLVCTLNVCITIVCNSSWVLKSSKENNACTKFLKANKVYGQCRSDRKWNYACFPAKNTGNKERLVFS